MKKVLIAELSEVGTRVERDLDDAAVRELLSSTGLELVEGPSFAELRLDVFRLGTIVHVHGSLRGAYHLTCGRCLAPARVLLEEDKLSLSYVPRAAWAAEGEEVELEAEDLETYAHDGEAIDLGELLREHLLLASPIAPLCREDCPGLEAIEAAQPVEDAADVASEARGWKAQLARLKGSVGSKS